MLAQTDLETLNIGGNKSKMLAALIPKYHRISNLQSTVIATKTATLNAMVSA